MKINDYAVDLGYINNEMCLIEFSPLIRCTSARLFRWDENYKEMTEGEGRLTIREKEYEYINDFIYDWEKAFKSLSVIMMTIFLKIIIVMSHIFLYLLVF